MRTRLILVIAVLGITGVGSYLLPTKATESELPDKVIENNKSQALHAKPPSKAIISRDITVSSYQASDLVREEIPNWLSEFGSLSSEEALLEKDIIASVNRFYSIGFIKDRDMKTLRDSVWKLKSKISYSIGKQLWNMEKSTIETREDAEIAVELLDTLRYFAKAEAIDSLEVIKDLAARDLEWDENGNMKEPLKTTITLEAFQIMSQVAPLQAALFMKNTIPLRKARPYFYHFSLGRKLAGLNDTQIEEETKSIYQSS